MKSSKLMVPLETLKLFEKLLHTKYADCVLKKIHNELVLKILIQRGFSLLVHSYPVEMKSVMLTLCEALCNTNAECATACLIIPYRFPVYVYGTELRNGR